MVSLSVRRQHSQHVISSIAPLRPITHRQSAGRGLHMFESSSSSSAWTPQPPRVIGVATNAWMPIPWTGAVPNNTVLFFINSCWPIRSVSIASSAKRANIPGLNPWARVFMNHCVTCKCFCLVPCSEFFLLLAQTLCLHAGNTNIESPMVRVV